MLEAIANPNMATVTAEAIGRNRGPFRSVTLTQGLFIRLTPGLLRTRNIALLSMFGVLSGTWMMFRFIAPQRGTVLATNEEMASIRDGESKQADGSR